MAHAIDKFESLLLMADVERTGRLVEQQHRRTLSDRTRQHDPLALTTAQRVQPALREVGEVELHQNLVAVIRSCADATPK